MPSPPPTPACATRSAPTSRSARGWSRARWRRPPRSGAETHPGLRRQPARLGALGRRPARSTRAFRDALRRPRACGCSSTRRTWSTSARRPPSTYERSVASVAHNLKRAAEIGAEGVVVHTGSYVDRGRRRDAGDAPGPRGAAPGARRGRRPTTRAVAAARADRRAGPLAVRRGRGPRALPRRARPPPERRASAWTPATSSPPAPRSTSPAARPRPSTGSSRSAGAGRLRLVHANDSMDVRGAFKDRHQKIGDGHIGSARSRSCSRTRPPRACRSCWRRPAPGTSATRRSRCSRSSASGERRPRPSYAPCWPRSRCSAMTACWGSTFFLIKDLLDRVPVAGLPGRPVRDRERRAAAARPARGAAGSRRDVAAAGGRARRCCTASRRSCRPPGWRTRRRACPASSPACTSCARRCSPPCCCAPGSAAVTWAAVALAIGGLGVLSLSGLSRRASARRSRSSPRCSTRCTSSGSAPGRRPRGARACRSCSCMVITRGLRASPPRPDGIVLPRTTGDWLVGRLHGAVRRRRWRCSARPGRRRTCRRPARRSS